jgi:MFS family permease
VAGADPVSALIRSRLSADGLKILGDATASELAIRRVLFNELNALLKSPDFYNAAAWQSFKLSAEAMRLAAEKRTGDANRRLNRLLLEAAYPAEVKPEKFYYDERHIGYLFAFCGVMSALVQGGMIGRLVKRFGEPVLISGSLVAVGLSLLVIPYAGTLGMLLFGLALVAMSSGLNRAPTMGLISIFTPAEEQGAVLGVTQSAGTLGRIFGPLFATATYALFPHFPYLAGAGLCVIAGLIAVKKLPPRSAIPAHEPTAG